MSNDRMPRRGVLLIVASPSGAGKTSLCRRLMADHGGLELSVSMTTRPIRPGEQAGRDYHFVDEAEFQRLIEADAFLEWANVHGNLYGSPRAPVDRALAEGRDVLFDIDWQGAQQIRAMLEPPSSTMCSSTTTSTAPMRSWPTSIMRSGRAGFATSGSAAISRLC